MIETDGAETETGGALVAASWWGTAGFVITALLGWWLNGWADTVAQFVAVALFAVGVVAFGAGFLIGASRSGNEVLSVYGLFLASTASPRTRRLLRGAIVVQTIAALGFASLRPFTVAAFAILVPMFGLGCSAIWGARHGRFPSKKTT